MDSELEVAALLIAVERGAAAMRLSTSIRECY